MSTPFYDLASLVVVPSGYKASKVYAQKPQTTDGQLAFTRSTTATRVNASGLIETVSSNVPRLDYLGSTCPKLLLEPQRTNLVLYSEQLDNAAWLKSNITVTPNVETSPDGYTNADKIVGSVAIPDFRTTSTIAITNGISYTWSAYVKNAGYQYVRLTAWTADDPVTTFDLDAISVVSEAGPAHTSTIEDVGNGWRRITITRTSTAGVAWFRCIPLANATGSIVQNGVDGIYLWGAQIEAGAYATSYIPTTTAAVTRLADACSKTGISSLIGQTEGTLFVDFVMSNNATDMVPFDITGSDGKLIWIRNAGAQFYGNGTTLIASIETSAKTQGTRYKVAFVYGQNDFRLCRNGSLIGTDTSGTFTGTFSDISLNAVVNQANLFNQVLLFKTKLTNAQMAELTAL